MGGGELATKLELIRGVHRWPEAGRALGYTADILDCFTENMEAISAMLQSTFISGHGAVPHHVVIGKLRVFV